MNIIFLLIYIILLNNDKKEMTDCDELEKYVKMIVEKNDFKFLPLNQALSLQEKKIENGFYDNEDDNFIRDEIN